MAYKDDCVIVTQYVLDKWHNAVQDLINDCPGLTAEQDKWLTDKVKNLSITPITSARQIYAFRRRGQDDFSTCTFKRYVELLDFPEKFEMKIFYAPL